jgi:hypothetical protein
MVWGKILTIKRKDNTMKQKINLKWYINRLEYVARTHKALNNDENFKSVMKDFNNQKKG